MPTVDFQTFADAGGANVIDQATYLALPARLQGFLAGLAQSAQVNKVLRQSAFVTAALAQVISTALAADVLDNGNSAAFILQLQQALAVLAGSRAVRVVTASVDPAIELTDYRIGFERTVGVAATPALLPNPGTNIGQSFKLVDLVGNFNAFPVTISPPATHTIAGLATFVLNEDRQAAEFCFWGTGIWSVET